MEAEMSSKGLEEEEEEVEKDGERRSSRQGRKMGQAFSSGDRYIDAFY